MPSWTSPRCRRAERHKTAEDIRSRSSCCTWCAHAEAVCYAYALRPSGWLTGLSQPGVGAEAAVAAAQAAKEAVEAQAARAEQEAQEAQAAQEAAQALASRSLRSLHAARDTAAPTARDAVHRLVSSLRPYPRLAG